MKRIPREMKICLWQNVLNVVNGITKYLKIPSPVFANKSRVQICETLKHNIKIGKEKKDFVFLRLKLVWPNDKDVNRVYSYPSFSQTWIYDLHFIFFFLKSTSLLQILKLAMGNDRTLYIAYLNIVSLNF